MAVYKDKWNGYDGDAWRVAVYYEDWKGERKKHEKRGFKTKREAKAYETEFRAKMTKDITMGFGVFIDIYLSDLRPQLKESTFATKEFMINTHIRPYFEKRSLSDISATDILQWQNALLSIRDAQGKGYALTYLRALQNQMNAIFNHAVKYYDLPKNPCLANKKMGRAKSKEMLFWTLDEYLLFAETMKKKPISYYAFEVLYWTGIRMGELLALTREDVDLEKRKLRINKTYQVVKGEVIIREPKTEKANRTVDLPEFLCHELEDYFSTIYKCRKDSRIFELSKSYLHHEMDRGVKASGVKRIRIHDLRHSHVAYLIELGFSPVEIAERLGHESISVTYQYAHLYPSKQISMAEKLNEERIAKYEEGTG